MEPENKTTENKAQGTAPANGFDLGSVMSNPAVMDFLKTLLPAGGAMAATYIMWVKPMQEKIETLTQKSFEQEQRIKSLEREQQKMEDVMDGIKKDDEAYFRVSKKHPIEEKRRKRLDL